MTAIIAYISPCVNQKVFLFSAIYKKKRIVLHNAVFLMASVQTVSYGLPTLFYYLFHVYGENNISIGNISSLPAIMSKVSTRVDKSE